MKKRVMAIGAHPDDIEFGCGGTLYKHKQNGDNIVMVVMTNTKSVNGVTGKSLRTKECPGIIYDTKSHFYNLKWNSVLIELKNDTTDQQTLSMKTFTVKPEHTK